MSFEDLQKLKERIGTKAYDRTVFGSRPKQTNKLASFKRANKNRPRETSSKRPTFPINTAKKTAPRDPRFDPSCGSYDRDIFKSNYSFLKDVRDKEREQLEKELTEEKDPKRKEKIKFVLQRMVS